MTKNPNKKFTVTSALPYANGPIHIGHLAGVYIPADTYVRYLRAKKRDVVFICGSDEHGVAITLRARKEKKQPSEIVDRFHNEIKRSFEEFGIGFDIYSRTSSKVHHETASEMFKQLHGQGAFQEKVSEQFYDESAGQFLADRYIKGVCPICKFTEAYGDQCEKCGATLSPMELGSPKSMLSGEQPVLKKTKHWYLPLNNYEKWLDSWLIEGHKEWKPNVYGQCKGWIKGGLQPRPITRDLDWGIPVPLDSAKGKVLYVWFDAPIGYISATKEWAQENGKNWEDYWKNNSARLIHFIGKDNIVFHCIIFPSILKSAGGDILPDNVPANEFLNLEKNKISTSRNWAVWLHDYLKEFPDKQDVLRYVLLANAPETKDNDFTWKDFQARNNNELVAILGNFVNRTLVLIQKYFDGSVPQQGVIQPIDQKILEEIEGYPKMIGGKIENFKFRDALNLMMEIPRLGNKYLADTVPWQLIKKDKNRVGTILHTALQVVANIGIISEPFLPKASSKIKGLINCNHLNWEGAGKRDLVDAGIAMPTPELLFQKIDDDIIQKQINKLMNKENINETDPSIPGFMETISFEDFSKLDLRVGQVISAEKIKKSDKLIKFIIDTGLDKRTVLSGIAKHFTPEEMVGKKVVVLVNLAPRKIMGQESQGMILFAENPDGELVEVTPQGNSQNGAPIK